MRRTALAAALIPCALVLTACGSKSATTAAVSTAGASASAAASGPSNAGLTQAELLARFKTTLATTTAIHFKGTMTQSGSSMGMDLQINKDGTAEGTVVSSGLTIPLKTVGGVDYVQVTPSIANLIKSQAGSDASLVAEIVEGKWISSKSSIGSSLTGSFSELTDFGSMTKQLATASGDTFTYLDTSTLNGQQVAQYKDVTKDNGTTTVYTMDIPLSGNPLPIKEDGGSSGSVTFTWNQPTTVTAPAEADILNLPGA